MNKRYCYYIAIIVAAIVAIPFFSYAAIVNITRNASVFTPSSVTITAGDQIKWINSSGDDIQPSSDPHPEHTNYTALNMGVIANGASSTTAALNNTGTWGYHDHLDTGKTGTIIIQAASSPSSTPSTAAEGYQPFIPPPSVMQFNVNQITNNAASINWRTDYYSYTKIKYGTTSGVYSGEFSNNLNESRFEHSAQLTNLIPDTNYYFIFVTGRPWLYTEVVTSTEKIFKTLSASFTDITPPVISDFSFFSDIYKINRAEIRWKTDEPASTQVEYGITADYGFKTKLDTTAVLDHFAELTGLATGTVYHFRALSFDEKANLAASTDRTFKTLIEPETKKEIEIKAPEKEIIKSGAMPSLETRRKIADIQSEVLKILKQVLEILVKIQAMPQ